MKNISLFIIIIIIFPLSNLFSQLIPYWKIIYEGNPEINSSRFDPQLLRAYNENIFGFASGYYLPLESYLVLTKDGGKTWFNSIETKPEKGYSFEFVDWRFINDKLIYCLIDTVIRDTSSWEEKFFFKNMILKSTDEGSSWKYFHINDELVTSRSAAFYMFDSLKGIAIQFVNIPDGGDVIWYTDDGWNSCRKFPQNKDIYLTDNVYITRNNEIIIKTLPIELFLTKDLGITWLKIDLPTDFKSMSQRNSKFFFYDDTTFFFIGSPKSGHYKFVAKSKDAGKTWEKYFETFAKDTSVINISFYNDSILYLHGNHLLYTSDNGKHWTEEYAYSYNNGKANPNEIEYLSDLFRIGLNSSGIYLYNGEQTLKTPDFTLPNPSFRWRQPLDFTIGWTKIQGADRCHLQVVEDEGVQPGIPPGIFNFDTTLFVDDSILVDTTYKLTGTHYFKTYDMRIRAINDSMSSPWLGDYHTTVEFNDVNENEQIYNDDIYIYPNPFVSSLNIIFTDNKEPNLYVELYDMLGIKILSKNIINQMNGSLKTIIEFKDGLNSGCYILVLKTGSQVQYKKIIKVE